jgi:hypothetical protein
LEKQSNWLPRIAETPQVSVRRSPVARETTTEHLPYYWKLALDSPEPEYPSVREVTGEPKARYYAVTPEAVRKVSEFLQATGWTCVYGIGMGTNTPARAAEEAAAFVAEDAASAALREMFWSPNMHQHERCVVREPCR